jgi:hypothetical protein
MNQRKGAAGSHAKGKFMMNCMWDVRLPGHGRVIWAYDKIKPQKEVVEIQHDGFRLWGQLFDSMEDLYMYLKTYAWRYIYDDVYTKQGPRQDYGREIDEIFSEKTLDDINSDMSLTE